MILMLHNTGAFDTVYMHHVGHYKIDATDKRS